jgi:hypothetical protein
MNTMTVNGNARSADVYPAVPLLWAGLRAVLQMTGDADKSLSSDTAAR